MRIMLTTVAIILFGAGSLLAFTPNGDGTVTDSRTGLVWQQTANPAGLNWQNAITYCEGLTLAGQSDWRLPNVTELKSIADITKFNPSIDTTYFPGTASSYYWSSTSAPGLTSNNALYVMFTIGNIGNRTKTSTSNVRCVRGGL